MILFKYLVSAGLMVNCVLTGSHGRRQQRPSKSSSAASKPTPGSASAQRELRYVVQEEMPIGAVIANIISDAGLDSRQAPEVERSTTGLQYRFMSPPRLPVSINETTGLISTTGRIDREMVCSSPSGPALTPSGGDPCLVRLDVAVTPIPHFHIIKVSLEILDINDNDPVFPSAVLRHEMSESSSVGSGFNIAAAMDRDVGQYGVQRYQVRDFSGRTSARNKNPVLTKDENPCTNQYFDVRVQRRMDGSNEVRLILIRPLDRETCDIHRFTVIAIDGGDPPRTATCSIVVVVIDYNDNGPLFEHSSYEVTIAENQPSGTTVARVTASDPDVGTNAEIEYQLSQSTLDTPASRVFAVDPITGDVIVIGVVDRESSATYRLLVTARNRSPDVGPQTGVQQENDEPEVESSAVSGSSTSESSDAIVIIHVEDSNDNPPSISVNTLLTASTDVALVPEAQDPGTFVAHVIVRDPDEGRNGRFDCVLGGDGDGPDWFRLVPLGDSEFQVVTVGRLDREVKDSYQLQITCKDGGLPSLVSLAQLRVQVTDVNDNRPQFERDFYTVELLENNYVGAVLLQVRAADKDQGQNAELVYSLVDEVDAVPFEVDPSSGVLRVRQSLDREQQSDFRFSVRVVDLGGAGLESIASVRVVILDVNDEPPRFRSSVYSVGIDENLSPETEVAVLEASDADSAPFDRFTFELLAGGSLSDAFKLDVTSGRLVTTRPLDREEQDIYHLVAVVRDEHSTTLTSTAKVVVHVMDTNDHEPVWTSPPADLNTTILVSARLPVGTIITRVRASDNDVGDNARLVYSFLHKDKSLPFRVDPDTGSVSISSDLSPSVHLSDNVTFTVTLTVSDHGVPTRRSPHLRHLVFIVTRRPPEVTSTSPGFLSRSSNGRTVAAIVSDGWFVAGAGAIGAGLVLLIVGLSAVWCVMRRRRITSPNNRKCAPVTSQDADTVCKYNCRIETLKTIAFKESQTTLDHHQQHERLLQTNSSNWSKPDILDCFDDEKMTSEKNSEMSSSFGTDQYDDVTNGCHGNKRIATGCGGVTSDWQSHSTDLNTFPNRQSVSAQ